MAPLDQYTFRARVQSALVVVLPMGLWATASVLDARLTPSALCYLPTVRCPPEKRGLFRAQGSFTCVDGGGSVPSQRPNRFHELHRVCLGHRLDPRWLHPEQPENREA